MPIKACMVAYTFYEKDIRVRRYAETLARQGHQVDVFTLRPPGTERFSVKNGVNIHRIQPRMVDEKTKTQYFVRILKFFFRSAWHMWRHNTRVRYDLVHVHSVPDFEVFAAVMPRLTGAKIILDIHDIVPEFYASKFHVGKDSIIFRTLVLMERLSAAFSDHVIISNDLWTKTLVARSVNADKCTAILNYPDPAIFSRNENPKKGDAVVFLYPGSLNWHQGLDIAVRAFALIKDRVPNARFDIYGKGPAEETIEALSREFGLENRLFLNQPVNVEQVAALMQQADIGVIPKRNDSFGGDAFSTKSLEFMLSGTPVIISKTRIDDFYFNDSIVAFFEPDNPASLADRMLQLATDEQARQKLSENAYQFVREMTWGIKESVYLDIVADLTGKAGNPVFAESARWEKETL